jgi:hypothetical protein
MRALRHYGISVKQTGGMADQVAAAEQQLSRIIVGGGDESARFTEIFKTAPVWLLQFTRMTLDACLLKFELPNIKQELRWGSVGYKEARQWPSLPYGTMTSGDSIPQNDERRVWISIACIATMPVINSVEDLLREDDEDSNVAEDPLVSDLMFLLDVDQKPENEWSGYERRRVRAIVERLSRFTGRRIVG